MNTSETKMNMQELLKRWDLVPVAPEVLDSSMVKTFMDCPSQFYLRYVLGLRLRRFDPDDQSKFDWGTCWHKVLEVYRATEGDVPTRFVYAIQALDANYPEYIQPDTDRHHRSKDRMIRAFTDYVSKWRAQDSEYKVLRVEQYFNVYNEVLNFAWCGRTDGIWKRLETGELIIWDYKTSSRMGKDYFSQHEVGFQFPGYVWAVNQSSTVLIDKIKVDILYMISDSHDFFRRTFRYIPERINEWVDNVKRITDRIHDLLDRHLYDPNAWEKNWNECIRYGRCAYFDVHATAPIGDQRLRLLNSDYVVNRWDPAREAEQREE